MRNGETKNPVDAFLESVRWQADTLEVVSKIHSLLLEVNIDDTKCFSNMSENTKDTLTERWRTIFQYLAKKQSDQHQFTQLSRREDHPDWFKGIHIHIL